MKKFHCFSFSVLALLCSVLSLDGVQAQMCLDGYDRADRTLVIRQENPSLRLLDGMSALAQRSANGVFSVSQREALEARFVSLREALEAFGERVRPLASTFTNNFLHEVIDPDYLGLSALTITGPTIEIAQSNARDALDALNVARRELLLCLYGSWTRVALNGAVPSWQCDAGYDRRDAGVVMRVARATRAMLDSISNEAQRVAGGEVLSLTQIQLVDLEIEYLREDLELLGERHYRGISRRSARFIRETIDPEYLGILDVTVFAATIEQSQAFARATLEAMTLAQELLRDCVVQ